MISWLYLEDYQPIHIHSYPPSADQQEASGAPNSNKYEQQWHELGEENS